MASWRRDGPSLYWTSIHLPNVASPVRFKIRRLRVNGRRLPWREILNTPPLEGDLRTYEMQLRGRWVKAATVAALDPAAQPALPDLYEPVLIGIAPLALQLRGFERHEGPEGPYSVAQEWHCELTS